jgi:hypothetical protein
MARYRVRFMKKLCDDSGHSHDCVEGIIYVRRAKSRDRAVRAAQRRFERLKRISRWQLYADTFYSRRDKFR